MGFKLRPGTSVFGNVTFTPGTNENYVAPPTHGSVNVALTATSTASTHISDRQPSLAHDGIIGISDTDGSTISNLNAWVTTGEGVGAWMQLDWSTPQTVNKIKLYDRPNVTHDHIKGGTLTFSDGSSVTVGELPDGVVNGAPDPLEVTFDVKTITWVRFTVDAFTGHNAGLTEFEVWSVLVAPEPAGSGDTGSTGGTTTTTVNYVIVGMQLDDDNGDSSGSVYVFDANDLSAQPTKLTAPDAAAGDQFGYSVTGAGDKIVVGARRDDDKGSNSGSVYVYDANDLSAQPTKLTAFDGAANDNFGYSVASYGDKIVVGSRLDDDNGSNSGSVYVYDATDLTAQPTKLTAFDGAANDKFGDKVAVSSNKIVVGAYGDDAIAGSAYVYDINDLSAQPTKLMPPDTADDQMFANAVAISENKIVIGAYGDDGLNPSSSSANSGAVYVYDANDLTAQPTKLVPSDVALSDSFGSSVAVFDDKIVIGSFADDDPTNSGSIYIYDANDLTAEPTKLTAPDAAAYHAFGGMLSYVGDTIVVSAYNSNDDGMANNGAVYVYDANDLTAQPTKLTAPDAASYDMFGQSVGISYTTTTTSSGSDSTPEATPEPEPSIVTEGLTFHVDAGNISSYSGSGDWIDLTGNGGDATLTNGMSFDAANGGSFAIDGVDDFAEFPSTALVGGNGAFTNEFWFKWSGAGGNQFIFGYGNDTGPGAVNLSLITNNKFRFEFGSGAGIANSTTTINTGTWYHAAVAYDQSSVKVYINGVLEATTAYSSANVPLSGSGGNNATIGALYSSYGNVSAGGARRYGTFGGNVAVVRQYNRALNGTEILFNYDASKDRY